MADNVALALEHPALTLEEASRLNKAVEDGAESFDRAAERMIEQSPDAGIYTMVASVRDTWADLRTATKIRVRDLQDRSHLELPRDYDVGR